MRFFLLTLLATFLLFSSYTSVFASDVIISQKVNPDRSLLYSMKRIKEKIFLKVMVTPKSKASYYRNLLDKRLGELAYIASSKNKAHIEKASQRYETTAGQLTEFILQNSLDDEKPTTKDLLQKHVSELDKLPANFEYDTAEWRFLMNDVNSAKIYISQL